MSKLIFLIAIISISTACGFFIGQQTKSSANSETSILESTKKPDFLKILEDEKIKELKSWEDDNGKFYGVIREIDEPPYEDTFLNTGDKLSIYGETGKMIYELKEFGINSIDFARFKPNSNQLIIETNGGGTDEFLKIIDYSNGKFVELNASEDTGLRGGWWTMPEYRSGIKGAYFKPSQLVVIQQIGGSDDRPKASIFRYKESEFKKIGEFEMQKLGDCIEQQIAKKK